MNLNVLQLAWAIADEDRVRRRSFADPTVSKGCSDESLRTVMEICQRCLAKEPAQRPSVEDVLWNLQFAAQVQDDWEVEAWSSGVLFVQGHQVISAELEQMIWVLLQQSSYESGSSWF